MLGRIHPNPPYGIIYSTKQIDKLRIYNLQGVRRMEASNRYTIDISRLPAGFYTLIVEDNKGLSIHKIIKN